MELQIALAGLHLRAVQMNWYDAAQSAAAQRNADTLLKGALASRPHSLPVLDAYCRFLTVTNQFAESLVACARALTVNPWDGTALYNLSLTQLQLGRLDDALAGFSEAERYDTPEVSRWTWLLGIGWTNLLLNRNEEAATFLQRSIAITPGSGRPYLLLAAAHHQLGHAREAREALAKAIEDAPRLHSPQHRAADRQRQPHLPRRQQRCHPHPHRNRPATGHTAIGNSPGRILRPNSTDFRQPCPQREKAVPKSNRARQSDPDRQRN